ncbi:MAG: HIT domain-containing protein [Pseudomonadales bacterium]|nr:HIT domain-containing protein [Pseudomonadales bacterium]
MSDFDVHSQLKKDCAVVGDASLCRVLLMNDSRFPWLILVPRIEGLRDLHEVPIDHRLQLFDEIESASTSVRALIDADKVNVAALGNQVPQLHVHVIGRLTTDPAWPGPVWGVGEPDPYESDAQATRMKFVATAMGLRS